VNRTRIFLTLLLAMSWGSVLAQDARADIRPPFPGVDSGAGTLVIVISIVAAIAVSAAIASFVLVRRKNR
jgi:hypothetical protein